jgi:hypothetical protein
MYAASNTNPSWSARRRDHMSTAPRIVTTRDVFVTGGTGYMGVASSPRSSSEAIACERWCDRHHGSGSRRAARASSATRKVRPLVSASSPCRRFWKRSRHQRGII